MYLNFLIFFTTDWLACLGLIHACFPVLCIYVLCIYFYQKAAERGGYGGERYEKLEFQKKVAECYEVLHDASWKVMDCFFGLSSWNWPVLILIVCCHICQSGKVVKFLFLFVSIISIYLAYCHFSIFLHLRFLHSSRERDNGEGSIRELCG